MIRLIYEALYVTLRNDTELQELLGIPNTGDLEADELAAMNKIQKRRYPVEVIESLPMIAFYKIPSPADAGNDQVYDALFLFDVYTNNDVNLNMRITDRLYHMFEGEFLLAEGLTTFKSRWLDGSEFETDHPDLYGFSNIIKVSVERPSEGL